MADAATFNRGLAAFAARITPAIAGREAAVLTRVMTDVVAGTPDAVPGTPFRTGYAKANWMPSLGAPSAALLPPFAESAIVTGARLGGGSAPDEHGMPAGEAESTSLERVPGVVAEIEAQERPAPAYVTSNVPYIQELEHGSSRQAPAGMARVAVDAIKALGPGR